jgi:acyl-CoA synthetase (AMP-forming)/AMP-acid ligase II/3-hydroxymyristoyl/3-hydroxydecanoyl-(acyl carrier protein) dehydratase
MSQPVPLDEVLEALARRPGPVALDGPLAAPEAFLARVGGWCEAVRGAEASRVGLFVSDRADFAAALLGAWRAGAEALLPGDALPRTVEALRPRCQALLGELPGALAPGVGRPQAAVGHLPPSCRLQVFTSGSTGAPVSVPKSLAQLATEVATLEATFSPGPAAVHATVSQQHLYGLLFTVLWPLTAGRAFSPRRLEYPEEVAAALALGPALLVASPAHLKRLPVGRLAVAEAHRPRAVFSSGGPLSEEAALACRQVLGVAPVEVYGSSETGGVAFRRRGEGPAVPFTALRGVRLRVDPAGTLAVQSPHLPDDGWYATSDLATLDAQGGLRLGGRADRLAKVEETRVSLAAAEARLAETGLLSEVRVAVLTGPRETLGVVAVPSRAGAALLAQEGKRALVERLRTALGDSLERVALPRRWRFVEALPVDAQGKTTQAGLLALLAPSRPEVRWEERSEGQARLRFTVEPSLVVLQGHFPEVPVVPGLAQLDWAVAWAGEAFGLAPRVEAVEVLKFQALMRPGDEVELTLTWAPVKATATFRYSGTGRVYSSGRLLFVPDQRLPGR